MLRCNAFLLAGALGISALTITAAGSGHRPRLTATGG